MKMHGLEFEKMNTVDFLLLMFERDEVDKLEFVDKIYNVLAYHIILDGYKKYFEIKDGKLIIQGTVCYDTVKLYYEFMSKEDKEKYIGMMDRHNKVA